MNITEILASQPQEVRAFYAPDYGVIYWWNRVASQTRWGSEYAGKIKGFTSLFEIAEEHADGTKTVAWRERGFVGGACLTRGLMRPDGSIVSMP